MKVLVTGANGYIGLRLIIRLLEEGHEVYALVRNKDRFIYADRVNTIEGDLSKPETLDVIPHDVESAYYLAHAMTQNEKDFFELEEAQTRNFLDKIKETKVKQIIYLSGITNEEKLSRHLSSRANVERLIKESGVAYTILQAGIIIGAASASFEIIRDLCEKLPIMIAPKWVMNRCQPIGIFDVVFYLSKVLGNEKCMNETFEIGGPDVMTYKEILLTFARKRGLKRVIINVPVLTPRLSSFWLYFITSTNYFLAKALVDSMKNEVIRKDFRIDSIIDHQTLSFEEAIERAFQKIEQNAVVSGWKDAIVMSSLRGDLSEYLEVPKHGCVTIHKHIPIPGNREDVIDAVWRIGGKNGWYYLNWVWQLRGLIDKLCGGVGLRRGRTHDHDLRHGDALDFWRVLVADREKGRLFLFAEMKVPGEAWLEFHVKERSFMTIATFRPKGVLGRLYWWVLYPIHIVIFRGMADRIIHQSKKKANN